LFLPFSNIPIFDVDAFTYMYVDVTLKGVERDEERLGQKKGRVSSLPSFLRRPFFFRRRREQSLAKAVVVWVESDQQQSRRREGWASSKKRKEKTKKWI
jgi:hypothetical protein|tara:strand:- start:228 stop:524 length:297 start_codon:yes stop_codon:yes gene_type:complete